MTLFIRGQSLLWITNYLHNHQQYVQYNQECSELGNISIGVPQGSILGPLLFLLYINDICNISSNVSCILFADDTNIIATGKNLSELFTTMNKEMGKFIKWIHSNKLSLNIEKTHYMLMSSARRKFDAEDCNIMIDNETITRVSNTKFLGVIIDETMSWKYHIDHICNKVSKCIGILLRARQQLYGHTLLTLYNSLIKPYFVYCITIWGNTYAKYLHKLELTQKRVIRIITFSEFCAHTAPLLAQNKIMMVDELHEYCMGILIYEALNHELPTKRGGGGEAYFCDS